MERADKINYLGFAIILTMIAALSYYILNFNAMASEHLDALTAAKCFQIMSYNNSLNFNYTIDVSEAFNNQLQNGRPSGD